MKKQILSLFLAAILMLGLLVGCGTTVEDAPKVTDPAVSQSPSMEPLDLFQGTYTNNGKTERTPIVEKILSAIEDQLIEDARIVDGTSVGDAIYYFVEDPLDCFPSEEHSVYAVIVDIYEESFVDSEKYGVNYIVGIGNENLELSYVVSHDLLDITLIDVTVRGQYSYWYQDYTTEGMNEALVNVIFQFMPELCNLHSEPRQEYESEDAPASSDNDSFIDQPISTITNENFEEIVDLGQNPFRDEDRFAEFFNESFGVDSECDWYCIGSSYSTFIVPEYELDSFDVYKVLYSDGYSIYYLVPIIGATSSVYVFTEEGLVLVWSGQT